MKEKKQALYWIARVSYIFYDILFNCLICYILRIEGVSF